MENNADERISLSMLALVHEWTNCGVEGDMPAFSYCIIDIISATA